MAIEYIPLTVYNTEEVVADPGLTVKMMQSHGFLRLVVTKHGTDVLDICLNGEDIWRAWQAVKPNENEWP